MDAYEFERALLKIKNSAYNLSKTSVRIEGFLPNTWPF